MTAHERWMIFRWSHSNHARCGSATSASRFLISCHPFRQARRHPAVARRAGWPHAEASATRPSRRHASTTTTGSNAARPRAARLRSSRRSPAPSTARRHRTQASAAPGPSDPARPSRGRASQAGTTYGSGRHGQRVGSHSESQTGGQRRTSADAYTGMAGVLSVAADPVNRSGRPVETYGSAGWGSKSLGCASITPGQCASNVSRA